MSIVLPMMRLAPPTSEWNSQDILHVPAGTTSVISMNIERITQGPLKTRSTSETLLRLRSILALAMPHSWSKSGFGNT